MNACVIDWAIVATWIGAIASVGLLFAAISGLTVWKSQFRKTRDHELAVRMLRVVSSTQDLLAELRSPISLISDGDVPVRPAEANGPDPDFEYRKMWARYRSRTIHLTEASQKRAALLDEISCIWDDNEYTAGLVTLIGRLGTIERSVKIEAGRYVDSYRRDAAAVADGDIDRETLYSPADYNEPDPIAHQYEEAKELIVQHLKPKIRM